MKTISLVFLTLLIVQSLSVKIDFESFVELSDLKGDSYAESLVQTINAALAQKGGSIDKVQNLLKDLENKLVQDQQKADRKWRDRYSQLNKTVHETEILIEKLSDEIATAKRRRAQLNHRILRGEKILKNYHSQLAQDNETKRKLFLKRNEDKAIYVENKHNLQNLALEIQQVISIITNLRGSVAGLKRPNHVEAISEETRDQAYKRAHSALLQVFTQEEVSSLLQLNTQADQDALSKLIDLLESLLKSVKKALSDNEHQESRSLKIFNDLVKKLNNDIDALNKAIKKQNDNLKRYRHEVARLNGEITSKSNLRKKNRQFLAQTKEIRRTEKLKYEADRRHREKERKIIKKLKKIVKNKLATMKQFLRNRVDN